MTFILVLSIYFVMVYPVLEHDAVGFRKLLNRVLVLGNVHDWDTGNLANAIFEALVAGGDNVAAMLGDAIDKTVVSVGALVHAGEPFEARISGNLECQSKLGPELLQLTKDAVRHTRNALGIQTVHHGLDNVEFVADGEADEVGVDEDVVGRGEGGVVLEEEGRGDLFDVTDRLGFFLRPCLGRLLLDALQARVCRGDELLFDGKLFLRFLGGLQTRERERERDQDEGM